ncbi:MAG TPA: hypothetical protein VK045_09990 [Ornithinicoccus sp.]|nr:hypothetical protein [Ornithinicoccus sp.]
MCSPVKCRTCQKTTWSGCGQHIASVKKSVPAGQWCDGQHSAEELAAAPGGQGFFSRMFSR